VYAASRGALHTHASIFHGASETSTQRARFDFIINNTTTLCRKDGDVVERALGYRRITLIRRCWSPSVYLFVCD
jgi:hypothetical protein